METQHLHDQITRATERLAQLQAREMVVRQRMETRAREATRKREAQRRNHYGQLVIRVVGEDLADGEIVAALVHYQEAHRSPHERKLAEDQGNALLTELAAGSDPRKN